MASHFEVYFSKGEWRFRLKAGNGEIIAASEGYNTKQGCLKGVASVQNNASRALIEIIGLKDHEEVTRRKLIKKIKRQEKMYKSKKNPILKPEVEVEDEKKVFNNPKSIFRLPGQSGPSWL